MEKRRQTKFISIIVLIFGVCTLAIGFSAFSATLNISSSATVTPNSEDFKIVLYGFIGDNNDELTNFVESDSLRSSTLTRIVDFNMSNGNIDGTGDFATIDRLTISNVLIPLTNPGYAGGIYVLIVNEGKYDAYFNTAQLNDIFSSSCEKTYSSHATLELVDAACSYITGIISLMDQACYYSAKNFRVNSVEFSTAMSNNCFAKDSNVCILEKNSFLVMEFGIKYEVSTKDDTPLADGPFVVNFDPISLTFTSANSTLDS